MSPTNVFPYIILGRYLFYHALDRIRSHDRLLGECLLVLCSLFSACVFTLLRFPSDDFQSCRCVFLLCTRLPSVVSRASIPSQPLTLFSHLSLAAAAAAAAAASSSSVLFCFLSFFLPVFFFLAWEQFSEFSERVCFRKMPRKEQRYTNSPNITTTGDDEREREREREREID